MTRSHTPLAFVLALLVALPLLAFGSGAGCGGDSAGGGPGDVSFGDVGGFEPDAPAADTGGGAEDAAAPADAPDAGRRVAIVFPIEQPVLVPAGGARNIPVLVLDPDPVDGQHLRFRLEPLDGGDGTIGVESTFTGSEGTSQVPFRAETATPATYDLVAMAVGTGVEARVRIVVGELPLGRLVVDLSYDGTQSFTEIRVGVVPTQDQPCSTFLPQSPPDSDSVVIPLSGSATFDLPADARYTFWVTARSLSAQGAQRLGAAGCLDGQYVRADATDSATVALHDLLLNPAGRYDMRAVFDFTDALPESEVGQVIGIVIDIFWDPAGAAIDAVELVVNLYLGQLVGDVVGWALDLFRDELEQLIEDWLTNNAPDWLLELQVVGQDLTQIVRSLELLAELRISKLTSDWYVQGEELWSGVVLHWRTGCAPEGDPAYDPLCGRLELSLTDIQDAEFPLDLVNGLWNGTITQFDTLSIDRHPLQLNYGRVILYVINEILLPYVSDDQYHSIYEAAVGLVDCEAIAADLVGDFLEALGLDEAEVVALCEGGIGLLVLPIQDAIYQLGADSRLRLQGTARLVDENDDLIVDRIVEGLWDGNIEFDPSLNWGSGDFSGTWDAVRK